MATEHLPRDLVRLSNGLKELAQKKRMSLCEYYGVCFVATLKMCTLIEGSYRKP